MEMLTAEFNSGFIRIKWVPNDPPVIHSYVPPGSEYAGLVEEALAAFNNGQGATLMQVKMLLQNAGLNARLEKIKTPPDAPAQPVPDGWSDFYFSDEEFPNQKDLTVRCPRCGKEADFYKIGGTREVSGWLVCYSCHLREIYEVAWYWSLHPEQYAGKTKIVRWPEDAWFRWEIRGHLLWAYNRAHAQVLLDFLSAKERKEQNYGDYRKGLERLPREIISAKIRPLVVKRISQTLELSEKKKK